ncbi:MAG: YjbQ family protein [Desulfobacterales bacterium]
MKTYRKELFQCPHPARVYQHHPGVETCLSESGIKEGLILVNAMHITASVFISDDESGLHHDYDVWLEKLAPMRRFPVSAQYGGSYMKRQIMGQEVVVAVTDGRLDFTHLGAEFYGEFGGRRRKRVLVKIIGD